jgi:hypothetical protein
MDLFTVCTVCTLCSVGSNHQKISIKAARFSFALKINRIKQHHWLKKHRYSDKIAYFVKLGAMEQQINTKDQFRGDLQTKWLVQPKRKYANKMSGSIF